MNKTSIPTLIGVFTSLLAIWLLHTVLVVNDCLAQGGVFTYELSKCMLENGQTYEPPFANYLIALYFIVGFTVSFLVSILIKKLINKPVIK